MKTCKVCLEIKLNFYIGHAKCKDCFHKHIRETRAKNPIPHRLASLKWAKNNKEVVAANNKKWKMVNRQKVNALNNKWVKANKEQAYAATRRWMNANRGRVRATNAARRAAFKKAIPSWLNDIQKQQIKQIYNNCPAGHHVDHIIPLQGKEVRGLHVPWNLQYLPASENIKKGNRVA